MSIIKIEKMDRRHKKCQREHKWTKENRKNLWYKQQKGYKKSMDRRKKVVVSSKNNKTNQSKDGEKIGEEIERTKKLGKKMGRKKGRRSRTKWC